MCSTQVNALVQLLVLNLAILPVRSLKTEVEVDAKGESLKSGQGVMRDNDMSTMDVMTMTTDGSKYAYDEYEYAGAYYDYDYYALVDLGADAAKRRIPQPGECCYDDRDSGHSWTHVNSCKLCAYGCVYKKESDACGGRCKDATPSPTPKRKPTGKLPFEVNVVMQVCGNYCGPGWCNREIQGEDKCFAGMGTCLSGIPPGYIEPTDCADKCCQAHDCCCGSGTDCNGALASCLENCKDAELMSHRRRTSQSMPCGTCEKQAMINLFKRAVGDCGDPLMKFELWHSDSEFMSAFHRCHIDPR